jgi:hypothetical protein
MVKKALWIILLLSFARVPADAQPLRRKRERFDKTVQVGDWRYGIQLGPSLYQYKPKNAHRYTDADAKFRPRFIGGIFSDYMFAESYALHLQVSYVGKGTTIEFKEDYFFRDTGNKLKNVRVDLDYLVAFIGVGGCLGKDKNGFLAVGLYLGYLLATQNQMSSETSSGETKVDLLNETQMADNLGMGSLRKMDVGIMTVGGYEFDMGLILKLAIDLGGRSIYESTEAVNLGANCSVGYNFAKLFRMS